MQENNPTFIVGIDLGTTHTVVAYAKNHLANPEINIFPIQQLIAPGQVEAQPLLPSVRYHAAEGELAAQDINFSPTNDHAVLGQAARVLGAKTIGRLVTSAKSWLSHPSIDQEASILPWGAGDDVKKISPLNASASYLSHIRAVWRHSFPDAPLEQQEIVITVPASFDEAARALTIEAAKLAGLNNVRLLEEPQAVCYDWLRQNQKQLKQALDRVQLLLICDVGGGTTDLTLIKVDSHGTEPKLTRIGVGDHLMLGGDNIDLTLAHLAESRLTKPEQRLSTSEFSQLLEQCRIAKERLLADDAPEHTSVALLGGGSKLIGQTRRTELTRAEVQQIVLEGFFPLSDLSELPNRKRSGVVEFGLPYASEPAISKHIAAFLQQHQSACQQALQNATHVPDGLLLNGGVFRSKALSKRIVELLSLWREQQPPVLLQNPHPELAVAYGAVSYALARQGKQIKIGGGSARNYFLLIDTNTDQQQGVCVLPRGSEEGDEVILPNRQFLLRLGMPVRFHLASLTGGSNYQPGDMVTIDESFHSLPPLAVALDYQTTANANNATEVTVSLSVTLTEVGTLKIQCVSVANSQQRWDVEFRVRNKGNASEFSSVNALSVQQIELIDNKIQTVFGSRSKQADPNAVKNLRTDLEKILAQPRLEWSTEVLRELFAMLLAGSKYQRRSPAHERVWLSLIGFCLRPGFGYVLDDWRVEQLWNRYPQGIQFVNEIQNWTEWWTLWRRIAGGLHTEAQQQIFADLAKYLDPTTARQPSIAKQLKMRGYEEIVRLAASLERLTIAQKLELGNWLVKRLEKSGEPDQTWWALGRIGTRIPAHASSHNVIPAEEAEKWLALMLEQDWKKSPHIGFAATLLARKSGDRLRDIQDDLRDKLSAKLRNSKTPANWVELIEQVKELDDKESKQFFGESLPPGLKLINQ